MVEISPFVDNPDEREAECAQIRVDAIEFACKLGPFPRPTNGDEELYPNRIANFSKALAHNDLGEVEPEHYDAMLAALASGKYDDFEAIQVAGTRRLAHPLGGLVFNIEGPDSPFDGVVDAPPTLASPEIAAQMAELYWMAVCRDVPLSDYDRDAAVAAAVADLESFPGYEGARPVTPQNLFRLNYPCVEDGPMVSQFLLRPFRYDGIDVDPRTRVPASVARGRGVDFLTAYDEWLWAQRGSPSYEENPFRYPVFESGDQEFDRAPRFIRSVRDMGQNAGQDTIYSAYFRAALIARAMGTPADAGNPYNDSRSQTPFTCFGIAHLLMLVGSAHKAERHTWYQKWNMHRFLRPEAFGGRVHNVRTGAASYPIDPQLLNSPVLDHIFEYNRRMNQRRGIGNGDGSYLLPILLPGGGPTHPAYPAGHAVSAGACVTMLKAWFEEGFEIPDPVKPSRDGLRLEPYVVGVDGPALTVGGELNKLAHNLSSGRDMSGVHWRADAVAGNKQGEEVAIRILQEARPTYPEAFAGFKLTKFDGTGITV